MEERDRKEIEDMLDKAKFIAHNLNANIGVLSMFIGDMEVADVVAALAMLLAGCLHSYDGQVSRQEENTGVPVTDDDRLNQFVSNTKDLLQELRTAKTEEQMDAKATVKTDRRKSMKNKVPIRIM